ncbi:hypothetical protein ACKWTF_005858 [Chironomus riparius]
MKKGFVENQNILINLLKKSESIEITDLYVKVEAIHEHKSSKLSESHDVIALRNPEELYHVEEFDDKQVKVEVKSIDRTMFCDICNKVFNSRRTLKDHTTRIHLQIKKHHCEKCQYSCFSSYELKSHKTSKHKKHLVPVQKIRCDQCDLRFSQQSCLVRHNKACHQKLTRFECDKCGHKTFKKENIIKHINTHLPNTSKRLFKCSKCSAQLTSLYILKMHEKNFHKKSQKSFVCQYSNCDKSFARKISLAEHQKFVHLKARPICCDKCEKSFSSKSHLTRHQKRKHFNSNNLLANNEID